MPDWIMISRGEGYRSPREMFIDLYYREHMSITEVAQTISVSRELVRAKMLSLGLPLRSQGGCNRSSVGPPCPDCGAAQSKVVSTRRKGKEVERYRHCSLCGKTFRTSETLL